jgi:hypothetical protein
MVELYTYAFTVFGAAHPLVTAAERLVSAVFAVHLSVAQARALLRSRHMPPPAIAAADASAEYCRGLLRILHRASPQRASAPAPPHALQHAFVELWANPPAELSKGRVHIGSIAGEGAWPPPQGYTVGAWLYFDRLPDAAQPLTIVAIGSGLTKASKAIAKAGSGNSSPRHSSASPRGTSDASAEPNCVQARCAACVRADGLGVCGCVCVPCGWAQHTLKRATVEGCVLGSAHTVQSNRSTADSQPRGRERFSLCALCHSDSVLQVVLFSRNQQGDGTVRLIVGGRESGSFLDAPLAPLTWHYVVVRSLRTIPKLPSPRAFAAALVS